MRIESVGLIFVAGVLISACAAPKTPTETNQEPGCNDVSDPREKTYPTRADVLKELRELQSAPRDSSGGGITRGAPEYQPDGTFRTTNEVRKSFKDIPAILDLVRDEGDLEKFEVLLVLVRDVDYSVHHAAVRAMESKYGYKPKIALTVNERLEAYERALDWWKTNKGKLRWNADRKRFVLE